MAVFTEPIKFRTISFNASAVCTLEKYESQQTIRLVNAHGMTKYLRTRVTASSDNSGAVLVAPVTNFRRAIIPLSPQLLFCMSYPFLCFRSKAT